MARPIRPAGVAPSVPSIPDLVKFVVSTARPFSCTVLLLLAIVAGGCAKEQVADVAAAADAKSKVSGGNKSGESTGRSGRGGRGAAGGKQTVEVINIARRDLSESLRVVGSLAANETATIRPEMNGLIRSIHFEEGRRVKKGDLLVTIDNSELQAQLAQLMTRHELAKLNLTRAENLRQTQSNTAADVDRARSEFAAAQADIELLKVRLARTEVRAPFDGVVEARTLSPGDYLNTQSIITTINDLSRLKVEFQVPERFIGKVRRGTKFTVKSTTAGDEAAAADGEVYFVNSVIDRNTRSSEVKGFLTKSPDTVKAGMFAVIEIVLEVRPGALTVPEGAIFVDQRGPQIVTVVDQASDKVAAFVPVRLGLRTNGVVEVSAVQGELSDQQSVVAAGVGSLALFPGAKLDPRPLRAEFLTNE
jgi:membrane fusion protein (multidrug efflux system)